MTTTSSPTPRFRFGRPPRLLENPHLETADEAGSAGLAQYLIQAGSRLTAPPRLVEALGLPRSAVQDAEHPAADRTCVIGLGAGTGRPRPEAGTPGIPALSSGEAVALLVDAAPRSVVVAGHYDTVLPAALTVGALAHLNPAWIVERPPAGREPGHASGGDLLIAVMPSPAIGTALCSPTVLLVTGVARTGAGSAEMDRALTALMPLALRSQAVVVEHADLGARLLGERLTAAGHRRVVTVGSDHSCSVRIVQAVWIGVSRAAVSIGEEIHQFTLVTPGRRSARAAAAAFAAGLEIGARPKDLAASITAFPGIPGFLTPGTMPGLRPDTAVLTSLARRPEEIADDLDAAFELTEGKVVVLADLTAYRPEQGAAFAGALAEAGHVVLLAGPDGQQDTVASVLAAGLPRESVSVLRQGPCEPTLPAVLADLATGDDLVLLLPPLLADPVAR